MPIGTCTIRRPLMSHSTDHKDPRASARGSFFCVANASFRAEGCVRSATDGLTQHSHIYDLLTTKVDADTTTASLNVMYGVTQRHVIRQVTGYMRLEWWRAQAEGWSASLRWTVPFDKTARRGAYTHIATTVATYLSATTTRYFDPPIWPTKQSTPELGPAASSSCGFVFGPFFIRGPISIRRFYPNETES